MYLKRKVKNMTIVNEKVSKIILIMTALLVLIMNILGHLFWKNIIISKELLLFFTMTTLTSQFVLLILIRNKLLLKIGFYYWLYVLIMNVAMTVYLFYFPVSLIRTISEFFLIFRKYTYWMFSTSDLLYLPCFNIQGGILSSVNWFSFLIILVFLVLYRMKIKKVATDQ